MGAALGLKGLLHAAVCCFFIHPILLAQSNINKMKHIVRGIQAIFRLFGVRTIKGQVLFLNTLLLLVAVGAIGSIYLSVQSDAANINTAGRQRMLSQRLAKEVLLVAQGAEQRTAVGKTIALFEASHEKLLLGDSAMGINPATDRAVRSQLVKVERLWKDYLKDLNGYLNTKDYEHLTAIKSTASVVLEEMNRAVKMMEALAEKATLTQAWYAMIMILVILFFSLIIFLFVTTRLVTPLQQLTTAFDRGAKGDFSEALPDEGGTGEMSVAFRAYNVMTESFSGMVGAVFGSAASVAKLGDKQSKLVESTVLGVRAQHSETDQVATAMTEMDASVQEVAQNIEHTAEAARSANTKAKDSSRIMTVTIGSMDRLRDGVESSAQVITQLEDESKKISTVLEVISSISEQTNLLALNAAIEAARAGEHGRGFAVVADEVRALAAKTKGSTDEINTMIERLQDQVREAVAAMKKSRDDASNSANQASEAGNSLEMIVSEIDTITQMTTQIATAAKEQSQVTTELSRNITNISSTSDNTSLIAEQTLEATQEINSKMIELRSHASRFRIEDVDVTPEAAGTQVSGNVDDVLL